jgi:two-component system, NtrC family, sensor kinase
MVTVLVVDDDPVNCAFVKEVLAQVDPEYTIRTALSAQDAWDDILLVAPDVVLLDVMMPGLDGFEFCRRLKQEAAFKNIPVLMITGLDEPEQKLKGFRSGAVDCITKPLNPEELRARVSAHVQIKRYHDELLKTQGALVESAKMTAIGSLAAGVAHEFNNILVMMSGYVQLFEESDDINDLRRTVHVFGELVGRGERIVKGLLDFARRDDYQKKERTDMKALLEQNVALLEQEFRKHDIIIKRFIAEDLPDVSCYPGQISQVIVNVLRNAIDAVKQISRAAVSIEAGLKNCTDPDTCQRPVCKAARERQCLSVAISDNGRGIPGHLRERVFEPFVTTKGVLGGGDDSSPGTGLGLSLSYGIIQRHKGVIYAEDVQSGGTKITILLPFESASGDNQ